MNSYRELESQHKTELARLNRTSNLIGFFRLSVAILFAFSLYQSFKLAHNSYIIGSIFLVIIFLVLLKIHDKVLRAKKVTQQLIKINENELTFLKGDSIPFQNGEEYIDTKHFYSYDLDIFGANSLFQYMNRTATYIGSQKLSKLLLNSLPIEEIRLNQASIKELSSELPWRQELLALSILANDGKENYQKLIHWTTENKTRVSKPFLYLTYLLPALFIVNAVILLINYTPPFNYTGAFIFGLNLVITSTQRKKIKRELIESDKIVDVIKYYALIFEKIEQKEFKSEKLNSYKSSILFNDSSVSKELKRLSTLLSNLQSIQNIFGALLFNGMFLYHVHTLIALIKWKANYSKLLKPWLDIIGEFESLNSFANFSFNNSSFTYPELNNKLKVEFKNIGHPLIDTANRVCNDVLLDQTNFTILTGSNMSGKSTFLRTLGINMVLAGTGSVICSTQASIHPLAVLVSMRQSDSLSDNESYFFAEIKRIKQIIDNIQEKHCFVLLDEVLKGTNSEDKRSGTIDIIKKLISKNAIGVIATHDLEVCKTSSEYPNKLENKCFEVDIVDEELEFDYKLRDGICKNKSATFLMKKMNII